MAKTTGKSKKQRRGTLFYREKGGHQEGWFEKKVHWRKVRVQGGSGRFLFGWVAGGVDFLQEIQPPSFPVIDDSFLSMVLLSGSVIDIQWFWVRTPLLASQLHFSKVPFLIFTSLIAPGPLAGEQGGWDWNPVFQLGPTLLPVYHTTSQGCPLFLHLKRWLNMTRGSSLSGVIWMSSFLKAEERLTEESLRSAQTTREEMNADPGPA